jgi:hypothetical protein
MGDNILEPQPNFKIYQDRAIYVGTFLGGPLVAGYFAAENFKQFGQIDKIKPTWTISILSTIVIFGCLFLIPNFEKVPNILVPLTYTGIAQFLIQKYQGTAIKYHLETGGKAFSIWRAVWVGLVGSLILLVLIFAIVLLLDKD